MATWDHVQPAKLSRMADFIQWVVAAEPALGVAKGTFLGVYAGNRAEADEVVLESSPLVNPLQDLLAKEPDNRWQGTATALLQALTEKVKETVAQSLAWPKSAKTLANQIRRLAPNLRRTGLQVEFHKEGKNRNRLIHLVLQPSPASGSSASSASSAEPESGGDPADGRVERGLSAESKNGPHTPSCPLFYPGKSRTADDADDADEPSPNASTEGLDWQEGEL
jgi:GNAT superfamily N-acetyltransferase